MSAAELLLQPAAADASSLAAIAADDPCWLSFLGARPEATAFHRTPWLETISAAYGLESFVLTLSDPTGKVVAGLPAVELGRGRAKRWSSLPFTDWCNPLGAPQDVQRLLGAIEDDLESNGVRSVEVRADLPIPAHRRAAGVTHELDLRPGASDLLPTFDKSQVQRNIKRAQREGVVVRRQRDSSDLFETFGRLHASTRRRLGVPVQPPSFFRHLWERVIEPGHGFVSIAEVAGVPAAAAVFLLGGGTVTYKFGASDARYWPQRPNHMLFWDVIRWSCEHGYERFDFGRTDLAGTGLRAFKSGWAATERELVYSWLGTPPGSGRAAALAASALRPVIRSSPGWVNQALGRALYRFAA